MISFCVFVHYVIDCHVKILLFDAHIIAASKSKWNESIILFCEPPKTNGHPSKPRTKPKLKSNFDIQTRTMQQFHAVKHAYYYYFNLANRRYIKSFAIYFIVITLQMTDSIRKLMFPFWMKWRKKNQVICCRHNERWRKTKIRIVYFRCGHTKQKK